MDVVVEEGSLESTPSWAVASVCFLLILIALLIEHALHLLTMFVRRRNRRILNQAVYQIKAELRRFGFMSLLLTIAKQPISKICIPKSLANTLLPCKDHPDESTIIMDALDSCIKEGKVPLVSAHGTEQLQLLIFIMAVFHLLTCLLTLGLGEAKISRWTSWEEATKTLDYQLSHDSRRFKLTRQTSFGKRHLTFWSNRRLILLLVCFLRQFFGSVSKADYYALRHGFVKVHLAKKSHFDFHKFLRRSLDEDFLILVRISPWIWMYAALFILFNAHGFYNHYWLPFIPLVMLLAIGMKLQTIICEMCVKNSQQAVIVRGIITIKPENDYFWFRRPKLLLYIIQFVLIQNSFQLAFFTWSWYKFGLKSCFHRATEDIVLSFGLSILVQLLCAYVTLPLYALVSQMGASMKETIFTERVVKGLKNWRNNAKRNLSKKSSVRSSPLMKPLPSPRTEASLTPNASAIPRESQFQYPSGRLELLEIQKVVGEIIELNGSTSTNNNEASFRMWWKQEVISPRGASKLLN